MICDLTVMAKYKTAQIALQKGGNDFLGSPFKRGLTIILTWISNYIYYKEWGQIIYPFPNL